MNAALNECHEQLGHVGSLVVSCWFCGFSMYNYVVKVGGLFDVYLCCVPLRGFCTRHHAGRL